MEVRLPGDVVVHARSLATPRPRDRPDFGVYPCGRRAQRRRASTWTATWRSVWLDWPPLGTPRDTGHAVATLVEAHRRARDGQLVEIACGSGRSRTGTALAALAVCAGLDADAALRWVRGEYPPARLVLPAQRRWLREVSGPLRAA